MIQSTLLCLGDWVEVKDGNTRAAMLYRRHYSCYQYADRRRDQYGYRARFLIVGPGEKLVLLAPAGDALFVWRKFIDRSGQSGVNCAVFRNESDRLSSELIRSAETRAWRRWPGERLYTYVNGEKVRSPNPGYCFQMAGWKKSGRSGGGLIIFQKFPPSAPHADGAT
jgi:hypothetical protein